MNDFVAAARALNAFADGHQHNRILRLRFPNGDGPDATIIPNSLDAHEGLSRDFHFNLQVFSDNARIALKDVQGKMVTAAVVREDGSMRYFNGYVFEFRFVKTDGGHAFYDMVLLPWLAYLRLRQDNYLFHDKNVAQQTEDIFADYAVADWKTQFTAAEESVTDACQFDESDYNYLHRRWEANGWHYRYEHREDGHTLVLGDDSTFAEPIDGLSPDVPWQSEPGSTDDDGISNMTPVRRIVPGKVTLTSFDFKSPRTVTADVPTVNQQGDVLNLEVYEYAGAYGFKNQTEGDKVVRRRIEEIEANGKHFEVHANDRYTMPGRWFRLTGHFDYVDEEFLILEVTHQAQNNYLQPRIPAGYSNRLTCIRKKIPWRPGRGFNSTEPKIYGVQTAIVVGPKGEEIHTDKYGRVKVQFHWDREGQYDEKSSAWIRVGSAWTGKGYGFIGIPRVGQEVVVQFLDGNPDRPLVTSCLFNEDNLPAWGFPEAAHQTGIQTRSTPGGAGHCEMVIHDKAGHELVNIRSQRDMITTVLHDHSTTVENNQATVVNGPQQTVDVKNGLQRTTVNKEVTVESQTSFMHHTAKESVAIQSTANEITLTAATKITLKVGASTLSMDADGNITVNGVHVSVIGSARVDINE